MATPPAERDTNMVRTGSRLVAIGAVLAIIGLVLVLVIKGGTPSGIGVALIALGAVPVMGGIGLLFSAVVSRRSRAGKPWA
jgi:hypothetical protein